VASGQSPLRNPKVEIQMSAAENKAVFLSYASQDAEAARLICDALRAVGVEVWFDQSELRGGDAWDAKIRKQIKECALFVPIISANTQARREGYFRLEWRLAVERMRHMDDDLPFLVPVVIDDTKDAEAFVPEKFRDVQWTRLAAGQGESAFAERVWSLLPENSIGPGPRPSRSAGGGKEASAIRQPSRRWRSVIPAAAAVAILLGGLGWWQFSRRSPGLATATAPTKSEQLVATARSLYEPWDLASADDFRMADGLLKQATEMDPLNGDAWASLAILSYGQWVFGFDASNARLELLRTSAERAGKLAPASVRAKFAQAVRYRRTPNMVGDALEIMRELADQNPSDRFILRQVGSIVRAQGQLEESLRWFDRAAALPGGDPIALFVRAQTLWQMERLDEAEATFERVLRERPEFARAHDAAHQSGLAAVARASVE
jgi:hypothetical protein